MKVYAYIYDAAITCISGPHKDHPSPPGWSITSQLKLQDLRRLWRWESLSRFFCARKSYVICGFSMFLLGTTGDLRCFIYLQKELGVGATFSATSRGRASTVGVNHEKNGCTTENARRIPVTKGSPEKSLNGCQELDTLCQYQKRGMLGMRHWRSFHHWRCG